MAEETQQRGELEIDFLGASGLWKGHEDGLAEALGAAAAYEKKGGAVAVLLGDDLRIAELNRQFRGKDGPTNVLSFPGPRADPQFIGDIALAAETIAEEANFQGKRFEHHAAHLVVHGFLHLLGYDHDEPAKAEAMEAHERAILASIGIADPYA